MLLQLHVMTVGVRARVWVCAHVCRGYSGARGGIVKRTIGVKLG